jgi:hypothetical protein
MTSLARWEWKAYWLVGSISDFGSFLELLYLMIALCQFLLTYLTVLAYASTYESLKSAPE